jgi:hypothetical protein
LREKEGRRKKERCIRSEIEGTREKGERGERWEKGEREERREI